MAAVLGLERMYFGDDFGDDALERIVLVDKLLLLIAEVAARLGAFDHDGVGNVLIFCKPFLAQQFRARADDTMGASLVLAPSVRNDGRLSGSPAPEKMMSAFSAMAVLTMSAKLDMATMTFTPTMPFVASRAFFQFLFQPPDRGRTVIFRIVFVNHSQAGRRNDADAALVGNGRSQPCERYAYAHTALHDGDGSEQISDFQCFHFVVD